jgi:hypothetical protein
MLSLEVFLLSFGFVNMSSEANLPLVLEVLYISLALLLQLSNILLVFGLKHFLTDSGLLLLQAIESNFGFFGLSEMATTKAVDLLLAQNVEDISEILLAAASLQVCYFFLGH